ncbi:hypothetical protein PMIN06_010412 [Paraphaeosphaeria minitans]
MQVPSSSVKTEITQTDTFDEPKRAETDADSIRSNTFKSPQRCGADPGCTHVEQRPRAEFHVILNGLFGFSPSQSCQPSPRETCLGLSKARTYRQNMQNVKKVQSSETNSESLEDSFTSEEARNEQQ